VRLHPQEGLAVPRHPQDLAVRLHPQEGLAVPRHPQEDLAVRLHPQEGLSVRLTLAVWDALCPHPLIV
jgi:hypothetical protein